jgi:hypothetical protein
VAHYTALVEAKPSAARPGGFAVWHPTPSESPYGVFSKTAIGDLYHLDRHRYRDPDLSLNTSAIIGSTQQG